MHADARADFGPCCCCGRHNVRARNIVMLDRLAPVPGTGWGCLRCGLPQDGAIYVCCDDCLIAEAKPIAVCLGNIGEKKRVHVASLAGGPFGHDVTKHPELRTGTGRDAQQLLGVRRN